jgi:hypothetical protein
MSSVATVASGEKIAAPRGGGERVKAPFDFTRSGTAENKIDTPKNGLSSLVSTPWW